MIPCDGQLNDFLKNVNQLFPNTGKQLRQSKFATNSNS